MSRAEEKALGRGFLAGIFWGALVSVAILLISNVALDRQQLSFPKPEAVPVEVPAGSEFDQARPESDPVVPEVETRPAADKISGVTPPPDAVDAPPAFDTSWLDEPQLSDEDPGGLGDLPDVAEEVEIDVTGPGAATPVQPLTNAELVSPDAPTAAPTTTTKAPSSVAAPDANAGESLGDEIAALVPEREEVTTEEAAPSAPTTDVTPQGESLFSNPQGAGTAPVTSEAPPEMTSPGFLEFLDNEDAAPGVGTEDSFFRPVEEIGDLAPEIETDRLPRIESDIAQAPASPELAEEAQPEVAGPSGADALPTIRRGVETPPIAAEEEGSKSAPVDISDALATWRQDFQPTGQAPLFSIVLVHQGGDLPSQDTFEGLSGTIAFAVDAGLPLAGEIADAYREQGREVVLIPSLPLGATPQDVEVALRVNLETVDQAVAVMDASGESFQSDREAVSQLVDVVAATGHGMITFPRGLNTAHQRAQRFGVPAGLVFRDIDGEGQTPEQILRGMDRAAFRASADRPVILVGRTERATLRAISEWSAGARAESVQLAPVSAVLLSQL